MRNPDDWCDRCGDLRHRTCEPVGNPLDALRKRLTDHAHIRDHTAIELEPDDVRLLLTQLRHRLLPTAAES